VACSEDKDGSKHYQRNNPDAERQHLTGNALEEARSRGLVVLHCHDDLLAPPSAQPPLRLMAAQHVHADTALQFVRAHRAAAPRWAGDLCLEPTMQNILPVYGHRCTKHQMYKTSFQNVVMRKTSDV
jgi:hypothetical protein